MAEGSNADDFSILLNIKFAVFDKTNANINREKLRTKDFSLLFRDFFQQTLFYQQNVSLANLVSQTKAEI
jgi:hypothetical protein